MPVATDTRLSVTTLGPAQGGRYAYKSRQRYLLATPCGGVESMLVNQLSIVMDTYLLIFTLVGHTALGPTIPSRL